MFCKITLYIKHSKVLHKRNRKWIIQKYTEKNIDVSLHEIYKHNLKQYFLLFSECRSYFFCNSMKQNYGFAYQNNFGKGIERRFLPNESTKMLQLPI